MVKILLAEDDVTMVSLLQTLLTMEGHQVLTIGADMDVPALARREMPDVLLLDVHLGARNGLDILDNIRNDGDTRGIRVVMTSGMSLKDECMSHGADEFLLKPYTPDELIEVLRKRGE